MREIVLDTETTGLDNQSDRLVEIAGIELENHVPTGNTYHQYINPERDVPEEAFRVHGLSQEYLSQFPVFEEVADGFVEFVKDAKLVIHNAKFDMGFLNAELKRSGRSPLPTAQAVDTLAIARRKYPGAQASLDALCRRFGIENAHRTLHGALLDADLLASVYLELIGGRAPTFELKANGQASSDTSEAGPQTAKKQRPHRSFPAEALELEAHALMVEKLKDPLWAKLSAASDENPPT